MLLDRYLPAYEFHENHSVTIKATPELVFTAMKDLTTAELSPLVFLLLDLRSLPSRLFKRGNRASFPPGPFLEQMYRGGFIPLAEAAGREIVFGLVGQFWKLDGGQVPSIHEPQAFLAFDDAGYAKVAANLLVQETHGEVRCSTETRIHVAEAATRRKFAVYWKIISMGSGLIRLMWLQAIKRKAEKQSTQARAGLPLSGGRSRR